MILSVFAFYLFSAFASSEYITLKDKINVRVDSTVLSDSLGYILKDQKVTVLDEKYGWYKIRLPQNFTCYISKEFTKKVSSSEVEVTGSKVNLRNLPILEANIIGIAPKGARFKSTGQKGQWVKIYGYPYITGWAHGNFFQEIAEDDIASFVAQIILKLSKADTKTKEELHHALIEKGENVVPLIESYIDTADQNTCYSIISVLAALGKNNISLIPYFLEKVNPSQIKLSSIYLDIVSEIIQPKNKRKAYYYNAQEGRLSAEDINNAVKMLKKSYKEETGQDNQNNKSL